MTGAILNLNRGTISYTRDFSFFHRLAWVTANLPLAGLSGSVTGAGDSSFEFATLLKGGPARSVAQFASYKPATPVGISLTITAPTGLYHANKVLNLGSNRWSFRRRSASRIRSDRNRSGRSTATPTRISTPTTPRIPE